jgi:Na+/proline symporter
MSTVDSALLSLSSILTQDVIRPRLPRADEARLTLIGKLLSWAIMLLMAWLAIGLPQTIWNLTVIKLELLVQAAPTILAGVAVRRSSAGALLAGVVAGVMVTLGLMLAGVLVAGFSGHPLGVHAGVWGLGVNVSAVLLLQVKTDRVRRSPVARG